MNSTKAQSIVFGAMATAVTITTIDALVKGQKRYPAISIPFGGLVATTALMGVANVAPDAAALFSVLVLTTALFGPSGDTFLTTLNRLTGTPVQGLKTAINAKNLDTANPNKTYKVGSVTVK